MTLVNGQFASFLPNLKCFFLILDGFYGCSDYVLLAIAHKLKLISKFKSNASLFLHFEGIYQGKGRPAAKTRSEDPQRVPLKPKETRLILVILTKNILSKPSKKKMNQISLLIFIA